MMKRTISPKGIIKPLSLVTLIFTLLVSAQATLAVEHARSLATDSRIKVVAFQEDNVVPVQATTFTTTQISFGKDEVIENIQNGDLGAWTVSIQKGLANMMFLKPTILGSNTNMTVVTNRHTYYFHLMSLTNQTQRKLGNTYAIHFSYPEDSRAQMLANVDYNKKAEERTLMNAQKNPQNYHWNYSFSGARSIMPLHIFDDGRFTYLQLQPGQPVPAIFAIDNASGKESLVNYRVDGHYLVVQQLSPQFTLREGKYHVASIFNNEAIHKLRVRGDA